MYRPSEKILERYADILVNFALGKGKGIKRGEVVHVVAHEAAKPFFMEVLRAITKAGGHVIPKYMPDDDSLFSADRDFYMSAGDHQLRFFSVEILSGSC